MSNLAETFYYQIYNCTLLGEIEKAKMYLAFLREEYLNNEQSFNQLKKDHRWQHLIELGNAIDNNYTALESLKIEDLEPCACQEKNEKDNVFSKQNDLVKAIIFCQNDLKKCLGAQYDFHCFCTEMETKFGRVDLVASDSITMYPIEVKKNGAFHDVVGQIYKYVVHFKLSLINRVYDKVIGVVIANSFDRYVLNELKKTGIVCVRYVFKSEDKVDFFKV